MALKSAGARMSSSALAATQKCHCGGRRCPVIGPRRVGPSNSAEAMLGLTSLSRRCPGLMLFVCHSLAPKVSGSFCRPLQLRVTKSDNRRTIKTNNYE